MKEIIINLKNLIGTKKFTLVVSFLGLYLLSSGVSLVAFSVINKPGSGTSTTNSVKKARAGVDLSQPKTEECPLNGEKFTKGEKNVWEKRRPATVMIENHLDSRPPSSLSKADVVYEIVAEGGITRFLSVFYCGAAAEEVKVAPVRSARMHFIDYAAEYGDKPLFLHVGGANNFSGSGDTAKEVRALETLETMGWRVPRGNDFDTIYDSGFPVFWRNYERLGHSVATEHTMMASLDSVYEEAEKRGFGAKDSNGKKWDKDFVKWKFADEKPESGATSDIAFEFWSNKPDYDVEWKYDSSKNEYLRFNGGKEHTDLETKTKISAKNVVILFAKEKGPVDRNLHLLYTTTGTGKSLIFQNGKVIEGTWSKRDRFGRTVFKDNKGKEIFFVRGKIWIEVVPAGNDVKY